MENNSLPKFVSLNGIGMRLISNQRYYRDGGEWFVHSKIINNQLLSWFWGYGVNHLHRVPLIEISEEEWKESNGEYVPDEY